VNLVDSDVLIAHLRGLPAAEGWLARVREREGRPSVSVIAIAEVTGGMRSAERGAVGRLLGTFHVIDVDEAIARRAGEYQRRFRRSHGSIGLGDYLVAGTASVRGLALATLDVRRFPMFEGLRAPFDLRLED